MTMPSLRDLELMALARQSPRLRRALRKAYKQHAARQPVRTARGEAQRAFMRELGTTSWKAARKQLKRALRRGDAEGAA